MKPNNGFYLRNAAAALLAVLLLAAPAAARRRSLNFRLGWRHRKSTATVRADGLETEKEKKNEPVRLMRGRWTAAARESIDALIAAKGKTSKSYDETRPPVAILPWSDAAVAGDPAELVFLKLITDAAFKFDDSWWEIIPPGYGRQPARAAYDRFVNLPRSVWESQPAYDAWRKTMLTSYLKLCRGVGRKACRSYLARLWDGWREDEAEDYAKKVLDQELAEPATEETVRGEPGDPKPLRVRRGLRVIPEMRDLVSKLREAGFDVWVVDDAPQPVLAPSAESYGVDPSRVYGVQNSTDGPRLGSDVVLPVPTRGGKTEYVQATLGRPADLAVGRDRADLDLLSYGKGLRIVFDGDPALVREARRRDWVVQPSFAR
jgi:phosphoserine phosphatase